MKLILAPFQQVLQMIDQQLRETTVGDEYGANRQIPVGLGALKTSILDQELVVTRASIIADRLPV